MLDVEGYLSRLGRSRPAAPGIEELFELHRAQVERIPYTTLDIHLGRACPLDVAAAVDRIVRTGRAGYCYNLNSAFAAVLRELGYDVRQHRGGVWRDPAATPLQPFANHMALTVRGLPTAANPGGEWFVDAGLGDALYEPMPLQTGEYAQGPFTYRLEPAPRLAGWRFRHASSGSFPGMDFESAPAAPGAFDEGHAWLSTSPESSFVKNVTVQRRDAAGADKLINRSVLRTGGDQTASWEITTAAEFFGALADVFGLPLDDLDADDRDRLWRNALAGHAEYLRSQDAG